jgi:hypothetical protein
MGRLQLLVLILGVAAVVRFYQQALLQPATALQRPYELMYNNDNATNFVAVSTDEPKIAGAATTATCLAVTPSPVPKQDKELAGPSIVDVQEDTYPNACNIPVPVRHPRNVGSIQANTNATSTVWRATPSIPVDTTTRRRLFGRL